MFMKRVDYDRFIHIERTSCNGEVIRRNNLEGGSGTTFSLKAKRFSGEEDRREFKM